MKKLSYILTLIFLSTCNIPTIFSGAKAEKDSVNLITDSSFAQAYVEVENPRIIITKSLLGKMPFDALPNNISAYHGVCSDTCGVLMFYNCGSDIFIKTPNDCAISYDIYIDKGGRVICKNKREAIAVLKDRLMASAEGRRIFAETVPMCCDSNVIIMDFIRSLINSDPSIEALIETNFKDSH